MHISLPSHSAQSSNAAWTGGVLISAFLIAVAFAAAGALFVFGPQMRTAQEAERAMAIEEENRSFCAKFGMGAETARYGECSAALNEIRTLQEQRTQRETSGIL